MRLAVELVVDGTLLIDKNERAHVAQQGSAIVIVAGEIVTEW